MNAVYATYADKVCISYTTNISWPRDDHHMKVVTSESTNEETNQQHSFLPKKSDKPQPNALTHPSAALFLSLQSNFPPPQG